MEGRGCNPELAAEPPLPRGRDVTEKPRAAAIVARTGAWMPTWQGQDPAMTLNHVTLRRCPLLAFVPKGEKFLSSKFLKLPVNAQYVTICLTDITVLSLLEDTYERTLIVDGESATIILLDMWENKGENEWLQDHCMQVGDAYLIVYSITDRASFEKASELRIQLRRARQTEDIPIILVGNKSDLVRCREVSISEGRACAVVFDCKFIETSAAVQHNVKELFEGIVRQVRLRRDSKEKNERRLAYQKRRESIPRKARRFWGKIVAKNNKNMAFKLKSKSCHDLSVL
ncbi:PREDICTED: GTP-binding protein GEM [Myotis davidii]|uniref:GTP-binding protein GEM n=1 Tax=Myotis davidii TaxID=225400 RepID=UPI00076742F9|nr:PREDICTED: GTP-binding protein GEM [Myotis davidii]